MNVRIVPAGPGRDAYLALLTLADDSQSQVRAYYQTGDLYALDSEAGNPLGVILTIAESDGSVELKAVAVDETLHNQGVGKRMLALVLADLAQRGVKHVFVGTASCSIGVLAYYQKAGFRLWKIERDYFTPARGYVEGIVENGIALRDMVWMNQEL